MTPVNGLDQLALPQHRAAAIRDTIEIGKLATSPRAAGE
jgi:hypothetical protein